MSEKLEVGSIMLSDLTVSNAEELKDFYSKVIIKLYDILGAEVMTLLNEEKEPGVYEVNFNAQHLSSGTYIYRIVADGFAETKKMILLK